MTCFQWHVCSFCGKPHSSVEFMVSAPNADICNECVAQCVEIIAGAENTKTPSRLREDAPTATIDGEPAGGASCAQAGTAGTGDSGSSPDGRPSGLHAPTLDQTEAQKGER